MLRGEVENGRRKLEMMAKKLEAKIEEVRKKDEFVQNVVMGKMKEEEKGVQGVVEKLEGYFGKSYYERLVEAEKEIERLREMKG